MECYQNYFSTDSKLLDKIKMLQRHQELCSFYCWSTIFTTGGTVCMEELLFIHQFASLPAWPAKHCHKSFKGTKNHVPSIAGQQVLWPIIFVSPTQTKSCKGTKNHVPLLLSKPTTCSSSATKYFMVSWPPIPRKINKINKINNFTSIILHDLGTYGGSIHHTLPFHISLFSRING